MSSTRSRAGHASPASNGVDSPPPRKKQASARIRCSVSSSAVTNCSSSSPVASAVASSECDNKGDGDGCEGADHASDEEGNEDEDNSGGDPSENKDDVDKAYESDNEDPLRFRPDAEDNVHEDTPETTDKAKPTMTSTSAAVGLVHVRDLSDAVAVKGGVDPACVTEYSDAESVPDEAELARYAMEDDDDDDDESEQYRQV
jgi:hypothetical protein